MTEHFAPPPGFRAALIFDDPTPNAIINNRIARRMFEMASFTDLNPEEMNDFADLVILIARKMVSVWKHLDAYHAEERRLAEKFSSPDAGHMDFSQGLYEEFDVFSVQIKSCLDHLSRILRPMLGRKWTMQTFSERGVGLLNSLKRNTGRKHEGRVRSMEFLLFSDDHKQWLDAIIESRDRMNHYKDGGVKIDRFAVLRQPDGTVQLPMWNAEQTLGDAMTAIWAKFFSFVENFIPLSLHFRIPEDKWSIFSKPSPIDSPVSPWAVLPKAEADALLVKVPFKPV